MTGYAVRPLSEDEDDLWNGFVAAHPTGRAIVTTFSRRRLGASGWTLHPIAAFRGESLAAGAALCLKKIPLLPLRVAHVTALMLDPEQPAESSAALLACAERVARAHRAVEIEIRCNIPDGMPVDGIAYGDGLRQGLAKLGYAVTDRRRSTFISPLTVDDEALLASLSGKCRRDVRKGIREGVTVERLTRPDDLRLFSGMHSRTCDRKGLHGQKSSGDYDGLLPVFERGYFQVFGARYAGELLNLALVDAVGIARWVLGASADALFEKKLPPTGQVLHFEIMRQLRDQGFSYYDMGGAPGPVPIPGHPNYTVWRFKREFGGRYVEFLPQSIHTLLPAGRVLTGVARYLGRLD